MIAAAPSTERRGEPKLLDVRGLVVEYRTVRGAPPLQAVDGVDLGIAARETVGVVGESGSGKSTIGRAIVGLVQPRHGQIIFDGAEITALGPRDRRRLATDLQVVFQDPYSSLNPTRTIGQTLGETLAVQARLGKSDIEMRVVQMLERVGLSANAARRYPSQFSGGQRQRIAIARALMVSPRLVICDEPVSALDLSVQAQILNLLSDLQSEFHMSYLFIAHDLAVVRHVSQRIVVLYRGRVMEEGPAADVYESPLHPYTKALVEAVPVADPTVQRARQLTRVSRTPQTASAPGTSNSCPFAARCPHAIDLCTTTRPPLERARNGTRVACHRWRELAAARPSPIGAGAREGVSVGAARIPDRQKDSRALE